MMRAHPTPGIPIRNEARVETTQAKRACYSSNVSDVPPYVEEPSTGP
jgi:hypothetical protein